MNKTTGNKLFYIRLALLLTVTLFCHQASALEVHKNLSGPFATIKDVTTSCLKCHHEQAIEVLQSPHWTWVRQRNLDGKNTLFGKNDSLTGFAIDVSSNPTRCMGCHISSTRPDVDLATPSPEKVDCLVCHDTTNTYRSSPVGVPDNHSPQELSLMARNVGRPSPANCTNCHFADCGLSQANQSGMTLSGQKPSFQDIHMDRASLAFTCQDCHKRTTGHILSRKIEQNTSSGEGCASCHTATPHAVEPLNRHTAKVTCQTCHIPQSGGNRPVMISWNWIMTGKSNRFYQKQPGGRTMIQDGNGVTTASDIEPVYLWDNGSDKIYTRGQRIKPEEMTYLQKPSTGPSNTKITPFRVIYGTQMYDTKYRYLISPLLQPTGSTFFSGSDWGAVARQGMHAIVLPFSGQYSFAPTAGFRRVNHGVVPATKALDCLDCHGSASRLPWVELGYKENPWSDSAPFNMEKKGLGQEKDQTPPLKSQPVKKLVIPPGSSF